MTAVATATVDLLRLAVSELSARCDGASQLDGTGFNRLDASFGKQLAALPQWTYPQQRAAWRMLAKYRKQLSSYGIEYDQIPVPVAPLEAPRPARETVKQSPGRVSRFGAGLSVAFRFDPDRSVFERRIADVKTIPGIRWNGKEKWWWVQTINPMVAEATLRVVDAHDLSIDGDVALALRSLIAAAAQRAVSSKAETAEITLDGLGGTLRPFQVAGVKYALETRRVLIGDEMGLGKTCQALATLHALNAFPALIISPATLKENWRREAVRWLPGREIVVLDDTDVLPADVYIVNYDVLTEKISAEERQQLKKERKKEAIKIRPDLVALKERGLRGIVLDECHYVKEKKTKRTKACLALAAGVDVRIGLSGTPLVNRPVELVSILEVLDRLKDLGGFWHYVNRWCGAFRDRFGWNFDGAKNLQELNTRLRQTCYVRRTKNEVLKELPAVQHTIVPLEVTNDKAYRKVEADVIAWAVERAQQDAEFLESLVGLPTEEQKRLKRERAESTAAKAKQVEQLIRIEALKQTLAEGKLEAATDWVSNFLQSGEKLVLFATHVSMQDALARRFPGCVTIRGDDSMLDRQDAVDRFQNDVDVNLIVCSLAAGGVGITLTSASNVALIEFGWNPSAHDQAIARCHRIGQLNSVNAWYLSGQMPGGGRTIDDDILSLIEDKRRVVDAATDGITPEAQVSIMGELLARLTERRG